jgi:hypothetical protein
MGGPGGRRERSIPREKQILRLREQGMTLVAA